MEISHGLDVAVNLDLKTLLSQLGSPDWTIRLRSALDLGELGDASAVLDLINRLRDENSMVRYSAVCALGKLHDSRSLQEIVKMLEDSDAGVIAAASAGMTTLCVPDLKRPSQDAIEVATCVLSSLDDVRHYLSRHCGAQVAD